MPTGNSYTSIWSRQVAAELRILWERAGLSGAEVAKRMGMSLSKISRIETGVSDAPAAAPPAGGGRAAARDTAGGAGRIGQTSTGKERGMSALNLSGARWHKSSRSSNISNCVEVAFVGPVVAVRDSKNPTGGVLALPPRAWAVFTTALRTGTLG